MISRDNLIEEFAHETRVLKHLATKIPANGYDYRPSDAQRSTLEVMRYLAVCGVGAIESLDAGKWDPWRDRSTRIAGMAPEDFPAELDRQMEEIRGALGSLDDATLNERIVRVPTGEELPLGHAIVKTAYAWMVAYRHEIFLRAKAAGASDLDTGNNWAGVDWEDFQEKKEKKPAES